ncbi:hypothetical protein CARUB_v10019328mg [Capsella rubella]|uniref:SKP1-like protein n=1 Tax=Capsella rubella TaxID=81985 RepID=R0FMT0_9BRAS|nr:hypothetical protein CARUB_v10019328mg [Capsella rubella]
MSTSNKIVLTSSDGESFEIDEAVARKLQIIAHMIDDDCAGKAIPLANVTGKILALVIEYCKIHVNDKDPNSSKETNENVSSDPNEESEENKEAKEEEVMNNWDAEFMKRSLTSQTVADYIKDKTVEEVREIFNIENDFTPEEEEQIRKENEWAFEK